MVLFFNVIGTLMVLLLNLIIKVSFYLMIII